MASKRKQTLQVVHPNCAGGGYREEEPLRRGARVCRHAFGARVRLFHRRTGGHGGVVGIVRGRCGGDGGDGGVLDSGLDATRQGWSRRIGVCDDFMKPCLSSSGCETRPAKGEPARPVASLAPDTVTDSAMRRYRGRMTW